MMISNTFVLYVFMILLSLTIATKRQTEISTQCVAKDVVFHSEPVPFYTQEICDGLYAYFDGFASVSMFLVGETGVIWVDAPTSMTQSIPNIASSITNKPITTVIYSHHHADHIGAANQIPGINSAQIICHENANKAIISRPDLNIPQCTKVIKPDVGNVGVPYKVQDEGVTELLIYHAGYRWHTNNDLFIFAPKQRTLMVVDLAFPGWVPYKYFGMSTDPESYRRANDLALQITCNKYGDWLYYIGGHVDRIGIRSDVEKNAQYYDDVEDSVKTAMSKVQFSNILTQNGGPNGQNTWKIINDYTNAVKDECANIVLNEKGWSSMLKGADVFTADHCFWILQELRINMA